MRRRRDEIDRDRTLAWQIEALRRQEKMPSFASWIGQQVQKQAPVDLVRQMQAISDLYGIPMRITKKES